MSPSLLVCANGQPTGLVTRSSPVQEPKRRSCSPQPPPDTESVWPSDR